MERMLGDALDAGFIGMSSQQRLLSAADVKSNPFAIALLGPAARRVNRFGADFRWQHLPVPFEVYADGIDLVVFEEFGSRAAALHLRDEVERIALLQDEGYRRGFRKDYDSKFGMRVWHRDFFDAEIVACPDESVIGKSFGAVGVERGGLHEEGVDWMTWSWRTAQSCTGAHQSPTTGPRSSRGWQPTTASRWASPTPARICATMRSTTSGCDCFDTSAKPNAKTSLSCRWSGPCTASPGSWLTGTGLTPGTFGSATGPT